VALALLFDERRHYAMNYYSETQPGGLGSAISESMDTMVRLPIKMTEGTVDAMMDGMRWMTNGFRRVTTGERMDAATYGDTVRTTRTTTSSPSSPSWMSRLTGFGDQDLGGNDLKYVVWSIVFTKPGHECVLQPQRDEIVNYEADGNSFAAIKIAKFIESARNGRVEKPEEFAERNYPPADAGGPNARRGDTNAFAASSNNQQQGGEKGFRIPAEDQRFITFLYRVERRLPKQDEEVTRVERVTVERGHTTHTAVA
jgi:hypothetical protein